MSIGGGHSLGKCKLRNSGYDGPWDNSQRELDNGYFLSMLSGGNSWELHQTSLG